MYPSSRPARLCLLRWVAAVFWALVAVGGTELLLNFPACGFGIYILDVWLEGGFVFYLYVPGRFLVAVGLVAAGCLFLGVVRSYLVNGLPDMWFGSLVDISWYLGGF